MRFALSTKYDVEKEATRFVLGNETKVNKDVTVKGKVTHFIFYLK